MSDYAEVKEAIDLEAYCAERLERRGQRQYVCPYCGSGNKRNKTAAFTINADGKAYHCYSCGAHGDVFDLLGKLEGIEARGAQLERAAEIAGITIDKTPGRRGAESRSKATNAKTATQEPHNCGYAAGRERHRRYLEAARLAIHDPEAVAYLEGRGITEAEAVALGMGYDPEARRIVIPWKGSDYYHIDRAIDHDGEHKYDKPRRDEVGEQPTYNAAAMEAGKPYYVVEGALDAIALALCGAEAVAIGGASSASFLAAARASKGKGLPIVMMDSDEDESKGKAQQRRICEQLEEAGIPYAEADISTLSASYKDAADALREDREALKGFVSATLERAEAEEDERREAAYEAALASLSLKVLDPSDIASRVYALERPRDYVATGIADLDEALGGGLPSVGLVVLGAVSSTGKTTLAVQIADAIAQAGRSALFVTIEQGADEIVAKSLSRIMGGMRRQNNTPVMASAAAILSGEERERWKRQDVEKLTALASACNAYARDIAPSMRIIEGIEQPRVTDLRAVVEHMAAHDEKPPVVFVDYLQLLAPRDDRQTDKQAVDANVTALRQLARELGTCVFVISSLNRSSYAGSVTLEAFKESGGIEYGADVLLGLQPEGMGNIDQADKEAKARGSRTLKSYASKEARKAEIVILKNRGGRVHGEPIDLAYNAVTNTFTGSGDGSQTA